MIENLPEQSAQARANVYSRTRDKLVHQLDKIAPPLIEEKTRGQVLPA
jgi:hypothetical protein